jgi:5'-nucleotidase
MKILLTNDDGIESPGLQSLEEALKSHELCIVAPDGERSGSSHRITLKAPVKFATAGHGRFACSGTPADCVLYSVHGAIDFLPDVVVSGINIGPNLGTDLIYSGTAAAARQAAFMGIPGIAVSQLLKENRIDYSAASMFIARNIERLVNAWDEDHFININVPYPDSDSLEYEITHPSRRIYHDTVESYTAPDGHTYHFLSGTFPDATPLRGTDWDTVNRKRISVSPIYLHPVTEYDMVKFGEKLK